MKDKMIYISNSDTMFYARFEKKHWWSKWKLYAMGSNKYGVLSKYNEKVKIIEQMV